MGPTVSASRWRQGLWWREQGKEWNCSCHSLEQERLGTHSLLLGSTLIMGRLLIRSHALPVMSTRWARLLHTGLWTGWNPTSSRCPRTLGSSGANSCPSPTTCFRLEHTAAVEVKLIFQRFLGFYSPWAPQDTNYNFEHPRNLYFNLNSLSRVA